MSIASIIAWLVYARYLIIFPLVILEGPIVMLICGFMIRLGAFEFFLTYALLLIGDLIGDALWYAGGRYGGRWIVQHFGYLLGVTLDNIEHLERLFATHQTKIIFVSKITMGFGFASATLLAAGLARVPFRKYMALNFLGGIVWTGVLVAVGYIFGNLYFSLSEHARIGVFAALLIAAVAGLYFSAKYLRAHSPIQP